MAEALSRVARSLESEPDQQRTLAAIVTGVIAMVAGAQCAGITLVDKGVPSTVAPSNPLVTQVNALQYKTKQGPCVDAAARQGTFRTGDLALETQRWPRFVPAVTGLGVRSMLAWGLFTVGTTYGSLNVYSTEPDAFDQEAALVGELFASHAAVALAGVRRQTELHAALGTRDLIATAKGILIARHRCDPEKAFRMLAEASQNTNMKLVDVAAWLVKDAAGPN
ncbi:GAF and ANTAR domain-containing protein [Umezawaea sp. Da 62-37]|uniref:GAF and ANTAR domain-containing protein n=1 Tax=Umezawaea sp. Da 62-37 TaxID=3075927 RepID=UPI0028F72D50|nr:GAF and ANTAR domain-containing protein [Umezawaea sp. Da 62-37]WNV87835.1 GAF and ANTAR domain-containing protein [Umezawaea sp. Da 62-37]